MTDKPDLIDLLNQDEIWCTNEGRIVKIRDMSFSHVMNLIAWLEVRAYKIKWIADWRMTVGPQPSGDVARDAFDDAHREQIETPDMEWLNQRPLMRKLREITS